MDFSKLFANVSFEPTQYYTPKGRYSVNIIYTLSRRIDKGYQFCDTRYYNTEQEKDKYIAQSIEAYGRLAKAYNSSIEAIKVDKKYWNTERLYATLDNLKH